MIKRLHLILERQVILLGLSKWAPNGNSERLCLTLKKAKEPVLGQKNKSQENEFAKGSNERTRQVMLKQMDK